jgi:hypothetical protein
MVLGTELQETVEECPESLSQKGVSPEHCWHGDETNNPVQGSPGKVKADGGQKRVPCRTSGQDKDNLTAFLVQNTSGEILSGEINVCTLYILFISYQI